MSHVLYAAMSRGFASFLSRLPMRCVLLMATLAIAAPPPRAVAQSPDIRVETALRERPGRMAESSVAVNPNDPRHVVAAADPYRDPVRVVVVESRDGGRTWSAGTEMLPDGFAKSYDPTVGFGADGDVIVVFGASQAGRPFCQPGSAVFAAKLTRGVVSYSVVERPREGVYVDRPTMGVRPRTGSLFATWTESLGPGAECLGTPTASSTRFVALSNEVRPMTDAMTLPSSGFSAPFGSSVAAGPGGVLYVAVTERDPGRNDRVVVVRSGDDGATFGEPVVVAEYSAFPSRIPGLGGIATSVASVTVGPDGRATAVWAQPRGAGSVVRGARERADGRWASEALDLPGGRWQMLPAPARDEMDNLWLVVAVLDEGALRFVVTRQGREGEMWELGTGTAATYMEVGQFLGLSLGANSVVAAAPIDGREKSRLAVGIIQVRARELQPTTTARANLASRGLSAIKRYAPIGVALLVIVAAAVLVRRRRAR